MKIKILINNSKKSYEIEINKAISALDLLNSLNIKTDYQIIATKINNVYHRLNHIINRPCTVEYLDLRNNYAWLVYQNSLTLLYIKAVKDILGNNVEVEIHNSLNKGLFTTIKHPVNKDNILKIKNQMHYLVKNNLEITKENYNQKEVFKLIKNKNEQYELLSSLKELENIEMYTIDNVTRLFYCDLVISTKYLKLFDLAMYHNGIILRYPHPNNPQIIEPYIEQRILYDAFANKKSFEKLMGIKYVSDLNLKIKKDEVQDLIMLEEALHEKRISDIADTIKEKKKRIILITGPSSSGKTSFAKRLIIQLKVNGIKPLYIGTDDYFLERNEVPFNEYGEKDLESINCLDIKLFNQQINDLLQGEKVDIPYFDFISGKKVFGKRITSIDNNTVIVIEGIHALNEILTSKINDDEKYKIYISPLTSLNIDSYNRILTTDIRLLRRIIRDLKTRGRTAKYTINEWPKVRKGETENIFPYALKADDFFNTSYIYELSIYTKIITPLLKEIKREDSEYAEAQRILGFLRFFEVMNKENLIANNSILREFIGGSILI